MDEWLDVFYMSRLSPHVELTGVVMLSHGNANVESRFSVNEEVLVENMSEGSLIAKSGF